MADNTENCPRTLPAELQKEVAEGKDHLKHNTETAEKNTLPDADQINLEREFIENEQTKNKDIGSKVIQEAVEAVAGQTLQLKHVEPVVKNVLPDKETIARGKVNELVQQFDSKRLSHTETEVKAGDPVGKVVS